MRDVETTLDWFNVRYYSPAQGSFQSVGPANAGADPSNPQTWNAYAYVGNNPLSITDPSGEGWLSFFEDVGFFFANLLTGDLFNFGTPSINGTLGNLESIAGLGGSSEPWNEQPPIGPDIQDPGQFVFDYNSVYHGVMTVWAGGSWNLAWNDIWVDWGTQGTSASQANIHAMGGGKGQMDAVGAYTGGRQTCGEAYRGTVAKLTRAITRARAGDQGGAAEAVHTIQDSYASGHLYKDWPGGFPSLSHEIGDWSLSNVGAATDATRRFLQDVRGAAPMGSPESYLAPRPRNCE